MSLAALPEYVFDEESTWILLSEMGRISAAFAGFETEHVLLALSVGDAKRLMAHATESKGMIESEIMHSTGIYRLPLKMDGVVPGESGKVNVRMVFLGAPVEHVQRREAFRVRILLNALVIFDGDTRQRDALTLDMSETGAGLWLNHYPNGFGLDSEIRLFLSNDILGDFEVDATVVRIFEASLIAAQVDAFEQNAGRMVTRHTDAMSCGVRYMGITAEEVGKMRNYLWYLQRQKRAQHD